jgi:hypothetical protein
MGTNGLWSVYFRGRYYIYYNHWDSYPEELGKIHVDQIPADPDELQRECRASLSRMGHFFPAEYVFMVYHTYG